MLSRDYFDTTLKCIDFQNGRTTIYSILNKKWIFDTAFIGLVGALKYLIISNTALNTIGTFV